MDWIRVELLSKWVEPEAFDEYKKSPFQASSFKTLELLRDELKRVDATNVVLYTLHNSEAIKRDGWPRADKQPPHPGVILEFNKLDRDGNTVTLRFPCHTFRHWEDNLRAIALALEALRKVDRYGVMTGAQYAGFKALPPAEKGTEGQTPEQAAEFVAEAAGMPGAGNQVLVNDIFADLAYKTAAKKLHPDLGGDEREFQKLENSMRLVRATFEEQMKAAGGNG